MHVLHKYSNTSPQMAERPMYKGFRAKETSRHTSPDTSRLTSRQTSRQHLPSKVLTPKLLNDHFFVLNFYLKICRSEKIFVPLHLHDAMRNTLEPI